MYLAFTILARFMMKQYAKVEEQVAAIDLDDSPGNTVVYG